MDKAKNKTRAIYIVPLTYTDEKEYCIYKEFATDMNSDPPTPKIFLAETVPIPIIIMVFYYFCINHVEGTLNRGHCFNYSCLVY